jgi:hypothetical protein
MDSMDTGTAAVNVEQHLADIKAFMPEVYKAIQARAKSVPGTFREVRAALRGEPNLFYAFERGRVVGTPFNETDIMADVASFMVQFECAHVCIWSKPKEGALNGTH